MTDTHDTNLPEKKVELEEEKKTAESLEPTEPEAPAENETAEKPAVTTQRLTKEEILARLKAITEDVENSAKSEIDSLKQLFYKLHNAELETARKAFIDQGGEADAFTPQPDSREEEFKSLMSVIKEMQHFSE